LQDIAEGTVLARGAVEQWDDARRRVLGELLDEGGVDVALGDFNGGITRAKGFSDPSARAKGHFPLR
jgi:hypothetical protein